MSKYKALCGLAQEVTPSGGRKKYSPNLPHGNHWTEFLSASLLKVIQGGCGLAEHCNSKSIRPKAQEKNQTKAIWCCQCQENSSQSTSFLMPFGSPRQGSTQNYQRSAWGGISMHCEAARHRICSSGFCCKLTPPALPTSFNCAGGLLVYTFSFGCGFHFPLPAGLYFVWIQSTSLFQFSLSLSPFSFSPFFLFFFLLNLYQVLGFLVSNQLHYRMSVCMRASWWGSLWK